MIWRVLFSFYFFAIYVSTAIPNVIMSCDGQLLKACFEPQPHVTERNYSLIPNCSYATIKKEVDGRVCIRINMSACEASHTKVDD